MRITADYCRLSECKSNRDNCGFNQKDCAMKSMYVALDRLITKTTKYSSMGISQTLRNDDVKEAINLLSIIEEMNK
jgi:hypothetical protein